MCKSRYALVLILAIVFAIRANAEVYKYTDSNGSTHYVDNPENVPEEYKDQVLAPADLPKITKVPSFGYEAEGSAVGPTSSAKVEIFIASWCPYCKQLEQFLSKQGIRYTRYDVEKSSIGKSIYNKLGGGGVPVVRIGETVIRGYNPDAVLATLKRAR
ncbi:MAG: glutaredoxin family protein [Bdellovibrionales bacterium]|nr:glutaredoxin family protein [Bdellovibrionales bacterium]